MDVNQEMETMIDYSTGRPRILLMEDESSVAQGLQIVLEEEGYGVDVALTGQSALETLEDKNFDLLVADLRLPDMDGMEVIRRVKSEKAETKVIVITGYANVPSAVEAMKTGVIDYLPKPFTEEEFMERVERALMAGREVLPKAILESTETGKAEMGIDRIEETTKEDTAGQPQILLMEDEYSVAQGLQMVLKEEGYGVDVAMTGQSALDTLNNKGFDLLLADLKLPDIDGMDVIKQVKDESPETKAIVITGYSTVSSAVDGLKVGISDYLSKPFTEEELLASVDKALKGKPAAPYQDTFASVDNLEKEIPVDRLMKPVRDDAPGQPKVLLMEDEPSVGQGLRMILDDEGYGVDLATTGQTALDTLNQKGFDLLVADLRLPDIDGMEVVKQVREKRPETDVIVITGYSNVPSAVEAIRIGVSDYLPKPFTEKQFITSVQSVINNRREALARQIIEPIETEIEKFIKIGFYACHCGSNISDKIPVGEVVAFARNQPNVVISRDAQYMCRDEGLKMIERDIREYGLNRVVVAGCSPNQYEETFQESCQRAGLDLDQFQMISLLEQVSWVAQDPVEAIGKAKSLTAAVIHRVNFQRTLTAREMMVNPDILVVGGGIAGMQAALDIAKSGHKAYLVEKQSTIGGHMLQFDKTFPTLDCSACIGTPKMVSVGQDPNIELLTYSEVKEISGFIGNYKVKIRRKPRYVKENLCTGCDDCTSVCPVTTPNEWDEGLADRKAIYRSFPQATPITFTIDKKDRAPCVITCPAGVNVQGYIQLIGQGKYREAIQLIMERLPLPGVLGRVCPHPCEMECQRSELDEALSIRDLKRFVADQVDLKELPPPDIEERPEKVAVVGTGPAGLTVSYYLRLKGYKVTIFEALSALGGMLRVGIPDYRLPPEILDREINHILDLGIDVETDKKLGVDFTLNDLKDQGFNAIFLGIGAHRGLKLNIPGEEDFEGVLDAVDFLKGVNFGDREAPGKHVAVIGGGNVAIDAARTALRLGSEEVTIVYRRTREEMPANEGEIEETLEEGVKILYLTAPVRVLGVKGKCTGIEVIKTELGEPDASGRRRPVPIEGSEFVIDCDAIIPAIGQRPDMGWAKDEDTLLTTNWDTFEVNPHTMQTTIPYVFASGDAVTGPATVIEAVSSGHKAVEAIHRFLNGEDLKQLAGERATQEPPGRDWRQIPKGLVKEKRPKIDHREAAGRAHSFEEVNLGFSEDVAKREAQRCINCGICSECMECVKVCEAKAIDHHMEEEELEVEVGSIIMATGYDLLDPTPMKQYGYGKYPNVITSLEFERLNNATGPTSGEILIRDENGEFTKRPKSVAILHCIGSRDVNYHEYCSSVCCMYALKYAHLIKDKLGEETVVYNFYIDLRCFGKGYEEFLIRVQSEGVKMIRGKAARVTDKAQNPEEEGKLITIAEDTLSQRMLRVPTDMVILCPAIKARDDADEVGRLFGIRLGTDGFFTEEHSKMAPLKTAVSGIFLAGTCQGPKDIPDTVAQASGAASQALQLAIRGKVEIPTTIAWIDKDLCEGCQTCVELCEYSAIEFDQQREISGVNQALCNGCGSCAHVCPNGALHIWQFKEKQIVTEADGIMEGLSVGAV